MKDLEELVGKVKNAEDGITSLIIPILKDSIKDGNQHNKRLFVINMMLVLAIMVISVASMIIIARQEDRYAEFLKEFDFDNTIYQATSDNSNINDGIRIMK